MDFREFQEIVLKKHSKGKDKIRNSWGVYDAYKLARKNKWYNMLSPVSEKDFYKVIRSVNRYFADNIAKGIEVKFPERMGRLELTKERRGAKIVNGKLKVSYPVKWGDTIKLWYKDEEARKNKILIRDESGVVYRVKYRTFEANYNNKRMYEFALNRFIKKALKQNIKNGLTDTLW